MGMVLRFPSERVRSAPVETVADEPATVLILPTVRIERKGELDPVLPGMDNHSPSEPGSGGRRRRRTPRN